MTSWRRRLQRSLSVSLCGLVLFACGARADEPALATKVWGIEVEASTWAAFGDAGFKIWEDEQYTISQLEYPVDGVMYEIRLGYAFPMLKRRLGVRTRVAGSTSVEGTTKDTDWETDGSLYNESEADAEATVGIMDLDLIFRQPIGERLVLGAFLGYGVHSLEYECSDLQNTYPSRFSRAGKVSTYDMTFTGMRLGALARGDLPRRFGLDAELVYLPALDAEGDANWILRHYPFDQEAKGTGLEGRLLVTYALAPEVKLFGGFRYVSLIADEDGKESGTINGIVPYSDEPWVEEITCEYFGLEFGARGNF